MSPEKFVMRVWSVTNQTMQPQKLARRLEMWHIKLFSSKKTHKGNDQPAR